MTGPHFVAEKTELHVLVNLSKVVEVCGWALLIDKWLGLGWSGRESQISQQVVEEMVLQKIALTPRSEEHASVSPGGLSGCGNLGGIR